jgi:predicted HicB family RNase H-like nuclease
MKSKKVCYKCKKELPVELFSKDKTNADGLYTICKNCNKQYYEANKEKIADYQKQYKEANKEKLADYQKQYNEANKEKIADYKKQYYEANKEIFTEKSKQYNEANKEKLADYQKQYYEANKEIITEKSKKYREANKEKLADYRKQYKKQWNIRLHKNISTALSNSLKTTGKSKRTFKYLGCTKEVFIKYLESKFEGKNMNWDNYGEWHIDHIIPLSLIDSTNEIEVMYIWHYTNLQPMWCSDNISKGNKIDLKYNNFTKFIDLKMKSFYTQNYNLKTHNFEIPNRTFIKANEDRSANLHNGF